LGITEVTGIQGEGITLGEIYKFKETGMDKNRKILGQFQAVGYIPSFIQKLADKGVIVPRDLFSNEQKVLSSANGQPSTPQAASSTAVKKVG
jgi:septum site-determining protein MinD